jgi:phosphatidylserine/phosphatidylglycerophosphate/cardiolipin synthase-like enzyme
MNASTSALTANREYLAVDTDAADVQQAEAIFVGDYAGAPLASTSGKLLASPLNMRAGVIALIQSATKTIDLESEELSDSAVVNALVAAHDAGVKVRVVIASTTLSTAQQAAKTKLKQAGIKGVETSKPYIHAKAIVVDGATSGAKAYVGSANFTSISFDRNRELGLITANATEIAKVASALSSDFSAGTAF